MEITFDDSFKKSYRKRVQGREDLERRFRIKLERFRDNPFDSSLKTHKLSGKLKDLWSFSVEYDNRAIFYFTDEEKAVSIDIGSPDQVY